MNEGGRRRDDDGAAAQEAAYRALIPECGEDEPPPPGESAPQGEASARPPVGAAPGTLVSQEGAGAPRITVIAYSGAGPDGFTEREIRYLGELDNFLGRWEVTWVNVDGLGDLDLLRRIGERFGLHGLALEDVIDASQRPKAEDYDDHLFVVARMIHPGSRPGTEKVAMFLGDNYLLTLQERGGDSFDPVRQRLRSASRNIRTRGADYLAYALIDAAIDSFFPVLEEYGEEVADLEREVLSEPTPDIVHRVQALKRELLTVRRAIWPQREMVNSLTREALPMVGDQTRLHLRDCYDHCIQLMDMVETYREIATGLSDIYLSSLTVRTNEIMRVLTVIATIFIPLSFVASLYGMNFDPEVSPWNMPELRWAYGYPFALALMAAVAGGLLFWFRRRGWLGGPPRGRRRRRRRHR
ncbi:MAG: magnesium/cobalt transporter CorA [Acetobacterales bacterium]